MRPMRINDRGGFTLVELLVSLMIASVVLAGTIGMLANHTRAYSQQDLAWAMEQNLRVSMDMVTDTVRAAGDGVPTTNLPAWIPWVSAFDSNPKITGTDPATVSVARCSPLPVARLSAQAAAGATTIGIVSAVPGSGVAEQLDSSEKRLVLIGDSENAHITAVSGNSITIDTDPTTIGNQGLRETYAKGTPLCRVDVLTFAILTDPVTGLPRLGLDENHGDGAQPIAEGISNLQVTTVAQGTRYEISVTARSEKSDPMTHTMLTRTLHSAVTVRNAI